MENFLRSKTFKIIIAVLLAGAYTLFIFSAGIMVGFHKAEFTSEWYEGYRQNFMGSPIGGHHGSLLPGMNPMSSHSVAGNIISIDASALIIKTADGVEKTVIVTDDTSVRANRDDVKLTDLKVGNHVVIIGSPNDKGQITAALIRVVDQNF